MRKRNVAVVVILVGIVASTGAWSVLAHEHGGDIAGLMTSERTADRRQGEKLILESRWRHTEVLRDVIRSPIEKGEQFYVSHTVRNTAIRLLGRLRAEEAVPDLIPLLVPQEGQGKVMLSEMLLPHAGHALVEIGLPAVRPLSDRLTVQGTSRLATECLRTLIVIEGPQETERLLTRLIEQEADATKKQNLQAALTLLKKPDFSVEGLTLARKQIYRLP